MEFDIVGFLKDVFLVLIWTTLVWKTAWEQGRETLLKEMISKTGIDLVNSVNTALKATKSKKTKDPQKDE